LEITEWIGAGRLGAQGALNMHQFFFVSWQRKLPASRVCGAQEFGMHSRDSISGVMWENEDEPASAM
jgi:hypothetical protein